MPPSDRRAHNQPSPLRSPALQGATGGERPVRRVLITGGAGFLGQALVRELAAGRVALAHDLELRAYDLAPAEGMPTTRGDILDPAGLAAALEGVDAVVHCATLVDWSDLRAAALERVNVEGTRAVLAACAAAGVQAFVHTSTMDVVCGEGDVQAATEDQPYPTRYLDAYGRTKAEAERVVRDAAGDMPTAILRFCAMYGEADPYKVPSLLSEARAGRLLFRVGDGHAHMQPLYIGNAAVAALLAVDLLLAGDSACANETYFIGDHPSGNFFDWMAPIMDGLGHPLPRRRLPGWIALAAGTVSEGIARRTGGRPSLTRSSVRALCEHITVDDSKARRLLGYAPTYSYDEAVARTVAWFRDPPSPRATP